MKTLGVDLAARPENTATRVIEWSPGLVTVSDPVVNICNRCIVDLAKECDGIGIDSPFGWPLPVIDFLSQAHAPQRKPTRLDLEDSAVRRPLRFRYTDLHVWQKHKLAPLSVSSDKLAIVAMRCVALLDRLGVTDRSGDRRV